MYFNRLNDEFVMKIELLTLDSVNTSPNRNAALAKAMGLYCLAPNLESQ
jgi:hypothetical protein